MFPMNMPEIPQEIIDMIGANPEGFAEAMGTGMEAMTAAMDGGSSPADAFEAMGDVMGPLMEDMGMSPDMFDAMGDMMGAGIGPAMHMAPADASPADMGAMMQDGVDMMMPPGMDIPGPIMDAMGDMGTAMGEAGMGSHDVAAEFMAPPGDAMYPLPMDGEGNPVVEPGQPETCPADACQPPPMDGACATMAPSMMPPVDGYDHAPMQDDFVMPEPFVPPTDQVDIGDPGADGVPVPDTPLFGDQEAGGANDVLSDAFAGPADANQANQEESAADQAVGNAMDSAMEQAGASNANQANQEENDPQAGMEPGDGDGGNDDGGGANGVG
jgi:hypothetical protein